MCGHECVVTGVRDKACALEESRVKGLILEICNPALILSTVLKCVIYIIPYRVCKLGGNLKYCCSHWMGLIVCTTLAIQGVASWKRTQLLEPYRPGLGPGSGPRVWVWAPLFLNSLALGKFITVSHGLLCSMGTQVLLTSEAYSEDHVCSCKPWKGRLMHILLQVRVDTIKKQSSKTQDGFYHEDWGKYLIWEDLQKKKCSALSIRYGFTFPENCFIILDIICNWSVSTKWKYRVLSQKIDRIS